MSGNQITSEVYDKIDSAIKYSIKLYREKLYNVSQEDLVNDLWVSVLEALDKKKDVDPESLNFSYFVEICKNSIVDIIRKNVRKSAYQDMFVSVDGTEEDSEDRSGLGRNENQYKLIELLDFVDKFPKGSKEREYLEWYLTKLNIKDYGTEITDKPVNTSEGELAKHLGFPSASSSSYRTFRSSMRKALADYFGKKI